MNAGWLAHSVILIGFMINASAGQPKSLPGGVKFTYCGPATKAELVGNSNQWKLESDVLQKSGRDCWSTVHKLFPGIYQYKFVAERDSTFWVIDSANPARISNYDGSSVNSDFLLTEDGSVLLQGYSRQE